MALLRMKKYLILIAFTSLIGANIMAQGEFSLYNLNKTVPQAHQLNPSFFAKYKFVVGLPVLSSTHLSINTDQLSFNEVFKQSSSGLYELNTKDLVNQLNSNNYITTQADVQLLFLGWNKGSNYFSLALNERVNSLISFSDDFASLAILGNGDSDVFNQKIDLKNVDLQQDAWHEIALGYARSFNDKLSIGLIVKYLMGIANSRITGLDGYALTNQDHIRINTHAFDVYTAGNDFFDEDADVMNELMNTAPGKSKNNGFAIDLGVNYQLTEKLNISAAINDLGYINWRSGTKQYEFNAVDYTFDGFEILEVINNRNREEYFKNARDSLERLFTPEKYDDIHYTSSLMASANAGANYEFARNHHVGLQAYAQIHEGDVQPAYGIYYNFSPQRVFNAVVNAGYRNGSISLVGVGASLDLGPIQIYATTESITSLIKPDAGHLIDARVGVNLIFGRTKKKEKNKEVETNTPPQEPPSPAPVVVVEVMEQDSAVVEPVSEPIQETIVEPEIIEAPKHDAVVVVQGNHKEELPLGYYVVVGAFESHENAKRYSEAIGKQGFDNEFGFLTAKDYYYVYVHSNIGNADIARSIRDEFRNMQQFEFPNAWLLSVVQDVQ